MGLGPFDLTGGPFLALYAVLFVLACLTSLWISSWLRPEGRYGSVSNVDRLAYLSGGLSRYADVVVARLYTRGSLAIERKRGVSMRGTPSSGETAAEISVLGLTSPASLREIGKTLRPYADQIRHRLVESGLMLDDGVALQLRFWQSLPLFLLLAFGAIKWQIGTLREKPVEFLTVFLLATLAAAVFRLMKLDRRTKNGLVALEDAQLRQQRLSRAAPTSEADLAVALFGTAALAGSSWSNLHLLRRASGGEGGSGSSDGGCGGGGCGGGGCGGCGS
jgi:uncharacterized protein (TIGR04222 family)